MTPRERMEAAGWKEVTLLGKAFWKSPNAWAFPRYFLMDEALEIVARDEAKESRRQGGDNSDQNGIAHPSNQTFSSDVNADEAKETSVKCQACHRTDHDDHLDWLDHPERHEVGCGCLGCQDKRATAEAYVREYASSSSAALQKEVEHQKANYNELKCEAKRKVAELTEQVKEWRQITANRDKSMVEQRGELSKAKTERDELRDSRDRLQEALRFADEFLAHAPHTIVGTGGVTEHNPRMCAKCVVRAALGDPPERGGRND